METTIRGLLEKDIDSLTKIDTLNKYAMVFRQLYPMKPLDDCLFGLVVGAILGRYITLNQTIEKDLTDENIQELWNMIEKRTMFITGQIRLALGK